MPLTTILIGLYHDGPEALKGRRLARLKELGLVDADVVAHPTVQCGEHETTKWEELPQDTRQKSARAMEVYSGMVDRMDWNIARVVSYLKQLGEYDNTYILVLSDNGAEGASYEALPLLGPNVSAHVAKYYNNSLDNIGRRDSFVWYGALWAQASTAPSRLYKMHSTEGGCRVPLVAKPPRHINNSAARISKAYCTVMDIVPTVLELAGLQHPGTRYKGRQVAPIQGKSWVRFLQDHKDGDAEDEFTIHDESYITGFEVAGSGALRQGHWKLVFVPGPRGPQEWELFNMRDDPSETKDLRYEEPVKFAELMAHWEKYKRDVGSVGVAGEFPAAVQGQRAAEDDEFSDPYSWIRYIGRPETVPAYLEHVRPIMDPTAMKEVGNVDEEEGVRRELVTSRRGSLISAKI